MPRPSKQVKSWARWHAALGLFVLGLAGLLGHVSAQLPPVKKGESTSLPLPDPPFRGKVGETADQTVEKVKETVGGLLGGGK